MDGLPEEFDIITRIEPYTAEEIESILMAQEERFNCIDKEIVIISASVPQIGSARDKKPQQNLENTKFFKKSIQSLKRHRRR